MADTNRIQKFYIAYYGRPADTVGLDYWATTLDNVLKGNETEMVKNFGAANQPEFQAVYPVTAIASFINAVYQNLFNRAPDVDGLNYWIGQYNLKVAQGADPNLVRAQMVMWIVDGAQDTATTKDATTLANKLTAAVAFTGAIDTPDEIAAYSNVNNTAGLQAARDWLKTVTDQASSVTTAQGQINTVINNVVTGSQNVGGQTFTLTTGLDNVTGTSGNDTINGTAATLTLGDVIDGGNGTDTLYIGDTTSAGGANFNLATIKNVENLVYQAANGADNTLNLTGLVGLQTVTYTDMNATAKDATINTKGNATSVTVKNAAVVTVSDTASTDTLASVTVDGNSGAATIASDALTSLTVANTNQNVTVTAAAGTRTLNLTLNNVTGGTITDARATTLKVNATGANSSGVALTANVAKAMEFSGDKKLTATLGAQATGLAITSTASELDLSGTTLNNDVTFTGGDGKESIKVGATTKAIAMGKGDDTVELTGSALGAGGTVNAGDGTDTLVMTHANAILATASTSVANFSGKVTGFEVLQVGASAGAGTINVGNLNASGWNSVSKVVFAGAVGHATTVQDIASNGTVEFKVANTAGTTVNVKNATLNTDDVLNIKVSNTSDIDVNTVTVANVETINLNTDDAAATPSGIAHTMTLTAANAKTLTVSGDAGVTLTLAGSTAPETINTSGVTKGAVSVTTVATNKSVTMIGGDTDTTFDASSITDNTKVATITTGAGDDIITGGAGDDVINAGNGTNTITGGGGADTMTGGSGVDTYVYTAVTDSQGTKVDVITNFQVGTGGDVIDLSLITGGTGAYLGVANGYGAVLTSLTGTAGDVVLDASTSTLYIDVNGDGALNNADMAIQLTGVTSGLVAANFVF